MARLFVSDVHLDAAAPEATEQFLTFLDAEAARAEALYILGDLFEAWVGDDDRESGNERVCRALRALAAGGGGLLRAAGHPRLPARRRLLRAQRLPAVERSGDRAVRRRAGPAHSRRCAVHRRSPLPGAAPHRAQRHRAAP